MYLYVIGHILDFCSSFCFHILMYSLMFVKMCEINVACYSMSHVTFLFQKNKEN